MMCRALTALAKDLDSVQRLDRSVITKLLTASTEQGMIFTHKKLLDDLVNDLTVTRLRDQIIDIPTQL